MPSYLHESLVALFRNRPKLAPELLHLALHVDLLLYTEAKIDSAELSELQPTEYRADLVVLLMDGKPVLGIVVEVQLSRDGHKRLVWPAYAMGLRARFRCPVILLVVCADDGVAKWAATPIELGGGNQFVPMVLGPSGVPEITDVETARRDPELAVLSAAAHGHDADLEKALRIAAAASSASLDLDPSVSLLYADLIYSSLSEAARKALQEMDPAKYEFQSEFLKRSFAEGKAEGEAQILLKLLALRFGVVPENIVAQIRTASTEDLERYAERVLSAETLEDVLK